MRQGQREGIRGVRGWQLREPQHPLHHPGYSALLRASVTNDGLLDLPWREFKNFQTRFGGGQQTGASRFSHQEGRLQVLGVEQRFDDTNGGLMLFNDSAKLLGNPDKATRS